MEFKSNLWINGGETYKTNITCTKYGFNLFQDEEGQKLGGKLQKILLVQTCWGNKTKGKDKMMSFIVERYD